MIKKLEKRGKIAFARCFARFLRTPKITPEQLSRERIDRLLVIRQHNQMGDMLMAVPAFRGLRTRFPDAEIVLIAAPINADVMINNPYVDEVLTYAKERQRRSPFHLPRFLMKLRKRRFDAVLVLSTVSFSITSMLIGAVSGARIRIGSTSLPFGHDLSSSFFSLELPLPDEQELAAMHESEHNLYPLTAIGVDEPDLTSILVPTTQDERECASFIRTAASGTGGFIVVHPGAGKKQNIWPPDRFASVIERLMSRHALVPVVVKGPVDGDALDRFLEVCPQVPAVVSCPTVGFLGALMKRALLTLCNDTGVMHIAGAVGGRCIALFGPTDPARWKPVNNSVHAVRAQDGEVTSVTVDEVCMIAESILGDLLSDELNV